MTYPINWATESLNSKKSFNIHLAVFVFTAPAIWFAWHLTGSNYQWHLWLLAAWVKGLQFHFLRAFIYQSKNFQKLKSWVIIKKTQYFS
jgi:DMSO reductase anchor subunit